MQFTPWAFGTLQGEASATGEGPVTMGIRKQESLFQILKKIHPHTSAAVKPLLVLKLLLVRNL